MTEINITSPIPTKRGNETKIMDFFDALKQAASGKEIKRLTWGANEYGKLLNDELVIYMTTGLHTWIISKADMVAIDWIVMEAGEEKLQ